MITYLGDDKRTIITKIAERAELLVNTKRPHVGTPAAAVL